MEDVIGLSLQPIMFLCRSPMFRRRHRTWSTHDYLEYELPGLLVISVVFAALGTGSRSTRTSRAGLRRFRSLRSPLGAAAGAVSATWRVSDLGRDHHRLRDDPGFPGDDNLFSAVAPAAASAFALAMCGYRPSLACGEDTTGGEAFGFIASFPLAFGSCLPAPTVTTPGWLQASSRSTR